MMRQFLALTATIATGVLGIGLGATPALAQPHQKTLIIYGDEPCPTSGGEEIVVCQRRPANEKYRIPKELRETEALAGSNSTPGGRVGEMDSVSRAATGMDTCSPVGAGGHTGCFRQAANANKKARRQDKADAATPLDTNSSVN